MSVHHFPVRPSAPSADAEVLRIGYAHYRRVEGDLVEAGAILRCAILLLADLADHGTNPEANLDWLLANMRSDAVAVLSDPETTA